MLIQYIPLSKVIRMENLNEKIEQRQKELEQLLRQKEQIEAAIFRTQGALLQLQELVREKDDNQDRRKGRKDKA